MLVSYLGLFLVALVFNSMSILPSGRAADDRASDEARAAEWCSRKWTERAASHVQDPRVSSDDFARGYTAFTRACMKSSGY